MAGRVGGVIQVIANGERQQARGNWTYNIGVEEREAVVGMDGVHGYTEKPRVPFIEGEITDRGDLDIAGLARLKDATVVLGLANGKTVTLNDAWSAGEWTGNTDEGKFPARFEGLSAQET